MMKLTDVSVVNLTITEDFYDYQGLFRLCGGEKCLDMNLADLEKDNILNEIKERFALIEDINTIKKDIMDKVLEASKIESRIVEGEHYNEKAKNDKDESSIGSLDMA